MDSAPTLNTPPRPSPPGVSRALRPWALLWALASLCIMCLAGCGMGCARLTDAASDPSPAALAPVATAEAAEDMERPLIGASALSGWGEVVHPSASAGFLTTGHSHANISHSHAHHDHASDLPIIPPDTPRPIGHERVRVAVISDLNNRYGSTEYGPAVHEAVRRLITLHPDLVLSAGDMVAGQRKGLRYNAMWKAFHSAVTKPLKRAQIPFAVAPGNHDASRYPQFAGERRTYIKTWREHMPDRMTLLDGSHYPLSYAFKQGPALFIALDATTIGPIDADQRAWLAQVLEAHAADASAVIVFGHVPLFPFAQGHADDEYLNDAKLEALLVKHGVDLVVSGHHHAYYPGRKGALRLAAVSCLGAGPRPLLGAPEEEVAQRSFLWIELDEHGLISVDALAGPDYTLPVDRQTLPDVVGQPSLWIARDDLTRDQALAAIEMAELEYNLNHNLNIAATSPSAPINTASADAPRPAITITLDP
jgi:acid phosphatase type 7